MIFFIDGRSNEFETKTILLFEYMYLFQLFNFNDYRDLFILSNYIATLQPWQQLHDKYIAKAIVNDW